MANNSSSISVVVRVRPFTVGRQTRICVDSILTFLQIKEAAQLSHIPDGPLFLGDGSLAAAPQPKLSTKGIRSVIKVVDDKCL